MDEGSKAQMSHSHEFGEKTGLCCYYAMLWEARLLPRCGSVCSWSRTRTALLTQLFLEMSAMAQALLSPLPHPMLQQDQTAGCCRASYLQPARSNGSPGFKKTSINYLIAVGVFLCFFFYQKLPGTSVLIHNKPFSSSN